MKTRDAQTVLKWLLQGKKIRNVDHIKDTYFFLQKGRLYDEDGEECALLLDLEDCQYEIYEEEPASPNQYSPPSKAPLSREFWDDLELYLLRCKHDGWAISDSLLTLRLKYVR